MSPIGQQKKIDHVVEILSDGMKNLFQLFMTNTRQNGPGKPYVAGDVINLKFLTPHRYANLN